MKLRIKKKPKPSGPVNLQTIMQRLKAASSKKYGKPAEAPEPGAAPQAAVPTFVPVPYPVGGQVPLQPTQPEEPETREKKPREEGIAIRAASADRGAAASLEKEAGMESLNVFYPLIPKAPKKGEPVFAYVNIRWNPKISGLEYSLVEPKIADAERSMIELIKTELEERLDIDMSKLGDIKAKEHLKGEIDKCLTRLAPGMDETKKRSIAYYVERDTIGLGLIHALMLDPNIEDISCDGVMIPLYAYHRNPKFGSIRTNVYFKEREDLNTFVVSLAQKCNKTISIASPLLDGALPDGSRIQATLGTDIARKGSNFTIRKFTEKPLTPTHILGGGTMNSIQLAYLWLAVENGQSILVSGGTATGKTVLLNALSLFIRSSLKIVSIEDTAELRLPHPHWIPHVARTALSIKGEIGEITLFDLLKSSLRQRPDYIVVGEVRGKEAFVLFQQMATGHPSLATIHAASIPQLIDRLIAPPISLPASLIENVNIVVFLTRARLKGSYVRRADTIVEITGVENDRPTYKTVFEWKAISDTFESSEKSLVLKRIAKRAGVTEDTIQQELLRRKLILEWMVERNITDYREVANIIGTYYTRPESLMELVSTS